MDRKDALRKIRACLARARSAGADEAAVALRQARALMQQYGVSEADAAGIEHAQAKTRSRGGNLPGSILMLGTVIADGFACRAVVSYNRAAGFTRVVFFGGASDVEVATYAFTVMRRRLERDRAMHVEHIRNRTTRDGRGETFARAWVCAVAAQFPKQEPSVDRAKAIADAIDGIGTKGAAKERAQAGANRAETSDFAAGFRAGRTVRLNRGVASEQGAPQAQLTFDAAVGRAALTHER